MDYPGDDFHSFLDFDSIGGVWGGGQTTQIGKEADSSTLGNIYVFIPLFV